MPLLAPVIQAIPPVEFINFSVVSCYDGASQSVQYITAPIDAPAKGTGQGLVLKADTTDDVYDCGANCFDPQRFLR